MGRVLVACEFSGVVRRAFRQRGHDAWSCDLLPAEDGGEHLVGDALEAVRWDGPWDLMICHPPCTFLATSGARYFEQRQPQQVEALEFVSLLLNAPVRRIALENPMGVISTRIRKPDQIIQPWMFGENASKTTCMWLKNLPDLKPTQYVAPAFAHNGLPRWANQSPCGANKFGPSPNRWKKRSRTFAGIAEAMADQWGAVL